MTWGHSECRAFGQDFAVGYCTIPKLMGETSGHNL